MPTAEVLVPGPLLDSQPAGSGRPNTDLVNANITDWKAALRGHWSSPGFKGQFIVFAPDRTPSERTAWGG
eukprot:10672216-Alexandrium_andersonii.AAC.1